MKTDTEQGFLAHLEELRACIIKSALVFILLVCVSFSVVDAFLAMLLEPVGQVVFIAPQEAFVARIKVAFLVGLLCSMPFIFYQAWQFIAVGLYAHERKYVMLFCPLSLVFFYGGALFGYAVIVPISVQFLLGMATDMMVPMITVSKYISFVATLTVLFGIIFELPLVSMMLAKIGVVSPQWLARQRKVSIVAIFIIAAIITPPDVVTQCLMAVPLMLLYEVGIIFAKIASRKK